MKTVKYQILHIFPAFFLAAVLSACSWLDVGSKSEIDGDEMFLSTEGGNHRRIHQYGQYRVVWRESSALGP